MSMKAIIPEGYKKTKVGIIPEDWNIVKLRDIATKCIKKNSDESIATVFSNSAVNGIVLQNEYFNKDIAQQGNLDGYYIVESGDFVYNPRISNNAPAGPINRNLHTQTGLVSPLYTVFRVKSNEQINFIEHFFKSTKWLKYMMSIANYGARHDRMNVTSDDFFDMPIPIPNSHEQQKIAEILTTWDEAITKQEQLIKEKEQLKKGLMQNLLSGKVRFSGFSDKWEEIKLKDILTEHGTKSDGKCEVHSVSVSKGLINQIEHLGRSFAAEDTSNYNLVKPFDIVYTKSPTGDFPFGIIKQNMNNFNTIVSPLYGVFTATNKYLGYFLHLYFESPVRTKNYLLPIIQKGAKNTINITNKTFLSKSISIPIDEKEQQKIVEVLSLADSEINLLKNELEELRLQKKALMQKLLTGQVRVKI